MSNQDERKPGSRARLSSNARLHAVHERIAALAGEAKSEAMRRASCSYSAPYTAVDRGGRIDGDEIVWPDGERYPIGPEHIRWYPLRVARSNDKVASHYMWCAIEDSEKAGHAAIEGNWKKAGALYGMSVSYYSMAEDALRDGCASIYA